VSLSAAVEVTESLNTENYCGMNDSEWGDLG
jgi:hypothetical protein